MSMVTAWIPSVWITSSAWSRLSGEDVRYGIRTPITFSLPSASTARNAVSDESTPPESPTIPLVRSEEHTSELQSRSDLVCRLLLEKKKKTQEKIRTSHTINT